MRLALGQMTAGEDKAKNIELVERLVSEASDLSCDFILFPEYAAYMEPVLGPQTVELAEESDGHFSLEMAEIARKNNIALAYSFPEKIKGKKRVYNTAMAFSSDGEVMAKYRKIHLYDAFGFRESDYVQHGDSLKPVTFEYQGFIFGLQICYDLRFPELSRLYSAEGTDVLLLPSAWVPGPRKEDHWETLVRARAIENTFYVAAVTQSTENGTGGSLISDPAGVVKAAMADEEAVIFTDISRDRIESVRNSNPSLANRRIY